MATKAQKAAAEIEAQESASKVSETIGEKSKDTAEVVVIGKGAIRIGDQFAVPGTVIHLNDSDLKSAAWKHLFVFKSVEFVDDSKRTREFIEAIQRKAPGGPITQ